MEKLENSETNLIKKEPEPVETKKRRSVKRACSVPQCTRRNTGSLHRFPKDNVLRNKWIKACQFNKLITTYTTVCNDHFLPSDFIPRWDGKFKRLKSIAVPTQNLPAKKYAKKLSPAELKRAEERAERAAKRLKREDPRYEELMALKKKEKNENTEQVSTKNSDSKKDVKPKPDIVINLIDNIIHKYVNPEKSQIAVNSKSKNLIVAKSIGPSLMKPNWEHNYSHVICKCKKDESKNSSPADSPEICAARILVELNEKVFEMIKNNEINFAIKDIILKIGEQFYFAARRYYKTTISSYIKNFHHLHHYTGIDFNLLSDLEKAMVVCEGDFSEKNELKPSERILLCFIKLRLNFTFSSLGSLFHLNEQTCKEIFYSTIQTLKVILRSAIYWPTKDEIMKSMPESFENFKKTVTVLDHTEIEIEKSVCTKCRLPHILINDNCEYLKVLLGFAKSGLITYVSRAIHGRTSNEIITDEAYISKVLVPSRDAIMTDGFFMEEACNKIFIECIKKRREMPFCPEATLKIKSKSVFETHIENAFRRFKMFKIFQTAIPYDMVPYVDDISVVICGIINLCNQTIATKSFE